MLNKIISIAFHDYDAIPRRENLRYGRGTISAIFLLDCDRKKPPDGPIIITLGLLTLGKDYALACMDRMGFRD